MNAFYDGKYDVLLSTTIVESGLDIPTANTLIVHRADMFGLAQLYQLRGRVGRSKRAPMRCSPAGQREADRHGRAAAEGAAVARHARRRLPARQPRSRHPRRRQPARRGAVRPYPEVGFELYQQMLEEAVAER
jgi:transcription-repair coupling factor (superfamily II helicase)